MELREILIAARALIEKGWCQGALARTADGVKLLGGSIREDNCQLDEACSWCMVGAIAAASPDHDTEPANELLAEVVGMNNFGLGTWNDRSWRTQAQVLEAFDKAIVRCAS